MSLLAANCRNLHVYTKLLSAPPVSSISNRFAAYDSKKFPGFKVIYAMEHIPRISIVNRLKYRMSIISGVTIPVSIGLASLGSIDYEMMTTFSFMMFSVTLFLHGVGLFCNNVIGFIYMKIPTEEAIISYVDFWGKRVDIEALCSKIDISNSANITMRPLFNTLRIDGHKKPLKMFVNGKILDEKLFDKFCGINF